MRQLMGDFGIDREFKAIKKHQTVICCLMQNGKVLVKLYCLKD